jgi:hypothetical protein
MAGHTSGGLVFAGGREIRISSLEPAKLYSSRAYQTINGRGSSEAENQVLIKLFENAS